MARSVDLTLTETDRQVLIEKAAASPDKLTRRSCLALLRLADGQSRNDLAAEIKVHPTTVGRWASQFRRNGVKGVLGSRSIRLGRPPKVGKEHLELLRSMAQKPRGRPGKWTLRKLARYFTQETGISIRPHYIGLLLRRMGIDWSTKKTEVQTQEALASHASTFWFSVAIFRRSRVVSDKSPTGVIFFALNLSTGDVLTVWANGRTPAAFIHFLEQLISDHPRQRVVLIIETGCVRITRQVVRFLESHRRTLEITQLSSPGLERSEDTEKQGRNESPIRFVFNSPEMLIARIQKGIQEIKSHHGLPLKRDLLSK